MIVTILNIILCCFLLIITFQDFKDRSIHVFGVVAVFLMGLLLLWFEDGELSGFIAPALFILVVFFGLWIYLSIKQRQLINPLKNHIGLGDVLFFFAITPLFSLKNYMLFFITGMLLSLILSGLFTKKNSMIPLAGILALYLAFLKIGTLFLSVDIFKEPLL